MGHRNPYLIVTADARGRGVRGHRRAGRHRLSVGAERPRIARPWRRPARHRAVQRTRGLALRYGAVLAVLGTAAVSGWLAASGAAAFAQMAHP
jgi:hypothetical protein